MKIVRVYIVSVFTILLSSLHSNSQTPRPLPSPYTNNSNNYIRTWDTKVPIKNFEQLTKDNIIDSAIITTMYADGLGRKLQTVVKNGSMKSNFGPLDLISAVEYDSLGREQFSYLSFAATSIPQSNSVLNDGSFKKNPFQQQAAFSSSQYPGETYFYGQTIFDNSPLSRPKKTMSPGNSWVGSNRGVQSKSWFNTVTDSVRIWSVTNATSLGFGTYSSLGIYSAGQLYKNITEDEIGNQVIEFKDKEGKVILKKVQLSAPADNGSGRNHTGWLCTYYIYDKLGQLRCVIQPKGVELINPTTSTGSNWSVSNSILEEQCFRYEYDSQGRMIIKKVPGAGSVTMVYDKRDRLIMTQDSNMRKAGQWIITQFDNLNRQIKTGIWNNSSSFSFHQNLSKDTIGYPFIAIPSAGCELLTETHYDDYIGLTSTLNSNLDNTVWGSSFLTTYNSSPEYAQELKKSSATIGLQTWSKVKVLGTSQYLSSVSIYDDKGRVIQTKTENITGGIDIFSTQYDFSGKVLRSHLKHVANTPNPQSYLVGTKLTYDVLGRLIKTEKALNNGVWKTLSVQEYDALGQLTTKKLGTNPENTNSPLETLMYDYNIRGWMLGANRTFAKTKSSTTNYFGFDLGYDKISLGTIGSYNTPQYNGNINGTVWKSKGDGEIRKYDFTYDAVNRLTGGNFNQYTGTTFNKTANIDFSVSNITYDANGNILTMNQKGLKLNSSSPIDALKYYYFTNSNKLQAIVDTSNDPVSKLGDFKYQGNKTASATDYSYDVNGNLLSDANKAITSIQYNHLNLPQLIKIAGKGTITYLYDAAGNKLKKTVIDSTSSPIKRDTTLYMAGIYQNSVLQFLSQEEGRIRYKPAEGSIPASFQWDYMLKDHLGNVRMVLTEERETKYYPATTLEGTFSSAAPIANSMVNQEKNYYNINSSFLELESNIPSWGTESLANTKLYYNHNNIPPEAPNPSYPIGVSPNSTAGSTMLYKLNATTNKTGLEFMAKVMAGDKIDIFGKSYYLNTTTVSNTNSTALDLLSLMTNMLLSPSNAALGKGLSASQLNSLNTGILPSTFFRGANSEPSTTVPKAYINYIFFDEQFKYAGGGASRVGPSGIVKDHWTDGLQNIIVQKNGYLFVYVSNESNFPVYFDNLQIVHKPGAIKEETHYYPFGLTMAGISSRVIDKVENKYNFTGQLLDNDLGLNLLQFRFRSMDPQIGRFLQIDPLSDRYFYNSTFAYAENDFVNSIDLEGLEKGPIRYMAPNTNYTQNRRMYREINSYVPRTTHHRNSGIYIPNQAAGSASTPANIYEPFEPGTGQGTIGPFVNRGNTVGKLGVTMTEMVDDLKSQIERVQIQTDRKVLGITSSTTGVSVEIKWSNKEAENKFNKLQQAYDNKVQSIRENNKVPEPPGVGATKEEWQSWLAESKEIIKSTNVQIALLGPSPTQQILNSTQNSNDFKKVKTDVQTLPSISQGLR